ncbi:unnamed protein product [Spirodela intermedia]|uniref:Tyrosine-protein kinase catalytic domain-containing protein n=1 Tax=Spirodela intermedia TaxID=51605 RepID=A0A7I8IJ48_SPIIN|nr:unnamed protein product [Spirodela intermedia]CAA6657919.1 unnamed protein product [Spirodela intermedia]
MEYLLILALCSLAVAASAQLPSQDILALLEFKKGVKQDPTGYILDSWNEESIDFNECGRVVLDNLGIAGDADLGTFTNLTLLLKLSMANNSISGVLSSSVGDFKSLKYLDISNNLFSGGLPEEIGKLKSLQNLSLAGNNFSGPLPHSIGELSSIQSLDLSRNSFSGSLPSTLTRLRSLVSLNLSFNLFTRRMLTGFEEISSLEVLDLSWNRLEGGIDWTFLMQTSAAHVDLSGNLLISLSPKEFVFLSDISSTVKHLNLSKNQLTGSLINGGGLLTFGSLKVLDLSHNQLSGDLPGFDYAYDLEVLRLGHNSFSGFVPSALLKGDSLVLSELDLSSNNLTAHFCCRAYWDDHVNNSTDPQSFLEFALWGAPLLTGSCITLDLSRNKFTGNLSVMVKWRERRPVHRFEHESADGSLPRVDFRVPEAEPPQPLPQSPGQLSPCHSRSVPKLTILDLSSNQFSGPILTDLLTSPTLQEFHLENNSLEGGIVLLQSQSSEKKSDLRILNLSGNRFNGTFPDDLTAFTGLQELNIARNNFSGRLPPSMSKLVSLTSLDISQNSFHGPLPQNLPSTLASFNASYNDLSGSVPAGLRKFPDSSFHPGNSMLRIPDGVLGSGNAPSGVSSRRSMKRFIRVVIIVSCAVAVVMLILLAIVVHYRRALIRARKKEASGGSLTGTSVVKDGGERVRTLVVSATDLIPRSSEKAVAMATAGGGGGGFSPTKDRRFSWSPESGESYPVENLGRLDVPSPDLLAGDLFFLDDNITLSPEELSRAPAEVLGRSSHGTSYKATLESGVLLTVKWLRDGEAKKFANIRHPNVVVLRGYYWGSSQHEKLILSDFISPGSLAVFLYDRPGRRAPPLGWTQRLKIAVDVARGLNYLHFDRAVPTGISRRATCCWMGSSLMPASSTPPCLGTARRSWRRRRSRRRRSSRMSTPSGHLAGASDGKVRRRRHLRRGRRRRRRSDRLGAAHGGGWPRVRVLRPGHGGGNGGPTAAKAAKEVLGIALRCLLPMSERPGIKSVYEDLSSI